MTSTIDGNFLIAWSSDAESDRPPGAYMQKFDVSGNRIGSIVPYNGFGFPFLVDGGNAVCIAGSDGNGDGVFIQRRDVNWNHLGSAFQANNYTPGNQNCDNGAVLPNGGYVVVWTSTGQGALEYGVYAQIYLEDYQISGTSSSEALVGGSGNDKFIGDAGADTIDGAGGINTVDYSASPAAVIVNMLAGTAHGGDAEGDVLTNCQVIIGSNYADTLTGNNGIVLNGLDGDDTLISGIGVESLTGGVGNDKFKIIKSASSTHTTITDFTVGQDLIDFTSFGSVVIHPQASGAGGQDSKITLGVNTVVLSYVSVDDLTSASYVLVTPTSTVTTTLVTTSVATTTTTTTTSVTPQSALDAFVAYGVPIIGCVVGLVPIIAGAYVIVRKLQHDKMFCFKAAATKTITTTKEELESTQSAVQGVVELAKLASQDLVQRTSVFIEEVHTNSLYDTPFVEAHIDSALPFEEV